MRLRTVYLIGVIVALLGIMWGLWKLILVPVGLPDLSFARWIGLYVFLSAARLLRTFPLIEWGERRKTDGTQTGYE